MRLTEKDKNGNYYTTGENIKRAYPKLGQLEDIEDELGIDLDKLLKCKYVFIKKGKKIIGKPVLINLRHNWLCYPVQVIFVKHLPFSKYGKTWALTKEELL